MVTTLPRLRRDLTKSRQEAGGSTSLVVKDPETSRFYRFRDAAGYIADRLDGETPLEEVRRAAETRFGGALPPGTLRAFIRNLDASGLLEHGDAAKPAKPRRQGRIRGGPLYLRLALFDPDALFTRLERRVRFLFTPSFVVLSAAIIFMAAWVTITEWPAITGTLARVYRLSAIPLILAVSCAIVSFHEAAHGLTCKHFGGEVHETGFMLIYFQPAFYANVSDAWLFPERSKRLWVGFAGPWFELFLWALATLLWRGSDLDSGISRMAYIAMTVSGVKTLFNFNPFIKLDGYYLLSDALDMPNLRRRSFRYVGGLIQRLLGLDPGVRDEGTRRERLVYLGYGLVAVAASVLAIGYAGSKIGRYLIENRQPAVLAGATGYLVLKVRRRYRKMFGGKAAPGDPEDDGNTLVAQEDDDSAAPPTEDAPETAVPPPHRKRRPKRLGRWLRRIFWAAAVAGGAAYVALGNGELRIGGSFNILPEQNADARAETDGTIAEIRVKEGDTVKAGQVIARLADEATLAELRQTEAAIRESRANLRMLEAGPTADSVKLARAAVAKAEDKLRYDQDRLARLATLAEQRLTPQEEYDAAKQEESLSRHELEQARGELRILTNGTRPEEIEAARAKLDGLESQRALLQQQLREFDVPSPITGIVATPSRELEGLIGTHVTRGTLIAKVYDFTTVQAQITVPEREIADVHPGQTVELRTRAFPNVLFRGIVVSIGTSAAGSTDQPAGEVAATASSRGIPSGAFTVTTRIDNPSLLLRPGMTGQAKINGGPARVYDLIRRRLARTFKVELWSWW
jgi:multidrug resistance efflux pump